ncbi:MAG: hypothetical protein KGL39_40580 [Patescibacteria group bacterium]|nr:hypothetical protein [Patescibacteria group bacterium]
MSAKDRRPWMKFRPDRWLGDVELQACSYAAQGLWINMVSRMHLSDEYGHLLWRGRAATDAQIALMMQRPLDLIAPLLGELSENGVFSRRESDNCIFSRRMVDDNLASETGRRHIAKRWPEKEKEPPNRVYPKSPPNSQIENKIENKNPPLAPLGGEQTKRRKSFQATLPSEWQPRDAERRVAIEEAKMSAAEYADCVESFRDWASRTGRKIPVGTEVNWDLTFRNDIRKTARSWGTGFRKQAPARFSAASEAPKIDTADRPAWWPRVAAEFESAGKGSEWRSYWSHAEIVSDGETIIFRPLSGVARDRMERDADRFSNLVKKGVKILDPASKPINAASPSL